MGPRASDMKDTRATKREGERTRGLARGDCMIADGKDSLGEKGGNALVSTEDGTEMTHEGNDQERKYAEVASPLFVDEDSRSSRRRTNCNLCTKQPSHSSS